MMRRILAMILAICMVLPMMGLNAGAVTLRDTLPEIQLQKDNTGKWADQDVERLFDKLPRDGIAPADVGDNTFEEVEPNDTASNANIIEHDYTVMGTISGTDRDVYVFELDTHSLITVASVCTTDGLVYGVLDAETQDVVAESSYIEYDEETGYHLDGLQIELPAGIYYLVLLDYYESSLTYMFYLEVVSAESHVHDYHVTVVEPTCTEDGYSIYSCTCGDSYMDDELPALGHDFNTPVFPHENGSQHCRDCIRCDARRTEDCTFTGAVTKEPTTTEEGIRTFTCDTCGNSYTESIPMLEHPHSYTSVVTPPTCTEGGYTTFTCDCGNSIVADETAPLGHDYENGDCTPEPDGKHHQYNCTRCDAIRTEACTFTGVITKEPTETEEGIRTYTCDVCGNRFAEVIVLANTFTKVSETSPADITDGIYMIHGISSQQLDDGTDRAFMTAENAADDRLYAAFFEIADDVVAAEDDYSMWRLIAVSGGFHIRNYATGSYLYYGDNSGNKIFLTEDIASAGIWSVVAHNDGWTLQEQASGRQLSCSRFGGADNRYLGFAAYETASSTARLIEFYKQNYAIVAHSHNYVAAVTEPTCTEGGYTTYTCSCGDSYVGNETEALGHSWDEGEVTKEPTETETGSKTYTCTVCGETYTEELPQKEHPHSYTAVITEPTCTEGGYTTYTCSCGDSYVDNETEALGHSWDEGEVTKEPTETETGSKTYTCTVCGETYTEELPKKEHPHSYTAVITEPTCTEGGYTTYTCSCGDSYTGDETEALGHTYGDAVAAADPDGERHYWECDRCGYPKYEVCNFVGTITKEPTTTEEGVKTFVCDVCGNSYTEAIPKLEDNSIPRIYGTSRVDTSFEIADALKEVLGIEKFSTVLIASGDNFADALAGSHLAAQKKAPILLYRQGYEDEIQAYIAENMTAGGKVYILGGTLAVPASMEDALTGFSVERLAGTSRFETNMEILEKAGVTGEEILIATGWNFADCLSASATGLPVLLVNSVTGELTDSQIEFLQAHATNTYTIIGGPGAVSEDLRETIEGVLNREVSRVYGTSREETSVMVAEVYFDRPGHVLLAYSRNFPDGLCGGPLAYAMGAPLLLINESRETFAAEYVKRNGVKTGIILGGPLVISEASGQAALGIQ